MSLPNTPRLLLGPGPSPVSARVAAALAAPQRSHLDPELVAQLDRIRGALLRVFRADPAAAALAISGTGTSGMEAVIANLTRPGSRALVVVTGYFGERLATVLARCGAGVARVEGGWGGAIGPAAVEARLGGATFAPVAVVHAGPSTGVCNPVADIARLAHAHAALGIVDAVTSLGAMPLEV